MSDRGRISQDELVASVARAKKVMGKVESRDFSKGHINEDILRSDPEEVLKKQTPPKKSSVDGSMVEKINKSNLPPAIKEAMINNPIQQISLTDSIDDAAFIKNARALMEREGDISPQQQRERQVVNEYVSPPQQPTSRQDQSFLNTDMSTLTNLVENVVRKVLDEKLTQILSAETAKNINENLVLRVGDSIFKGRITAVKKAK